METSPEHFSYKRDDNGPSRRPLPAYPITNLYHIILKMHALNGLKKHINAQFIRQ